MKAEPTLPEAAVSKPDGSQYTNHDTTRNKSTEEWENVNQYERKPVSFHSGPTREN